MPALQAGLWRFSYWPFFLTWVIVVTGLDCSIFLLTRSPGLRSFFFPALVIGGGWLGLGSLALLLVGHAYKNTQLKNTAWALGQLILLGWTISSSYKFFTGRSATECDGYYHRYQ